MQGLVALFNAYSKFVLFASPSNVPSTIASGFNGISELAPSGYIGETLRFSLNSYAVKLIASCSLSVVAEK